MSATTLNRTQTFEIHDCCNCGVQFAITTELEQRRREDHRDFYCPNGHAMVFNSKTKAEKERERAERLERQLEAANRRAANADENARAAHASLVATKGHLTRTKKRAANGVCPCCNRSFANVQRHVASQHPEHVEAHG